jgi:WD40 repeat protein
LETLAEAVDPPDSAQPQINPQSDSGQYQYAAFISYRHVQPDRKWAVWLHKALETYRIPKKLRQARSLPPRVGVVFRDEEELEASSDLSQLIETALRDSRYLIVVCSPRTPESKWINKEVTRFRELGRTDRILALLIEGEPSESFPASLRQIRRTILQEVGVETEQIDEIEPLAADVREKEKESTRYRKRTEKLRLIARVLECRFDELRQREQERQTARLSNFGALILVVLVILLGLSIFAFHERNIAIQQRAIAVSRELAVKALGQLSVDPDLGGLLAQEAIRRERTTEARHSLMEALKNLQWQVLRGHSGGVSYAAFSPNGQWVVTASADQTARVWEAGTGKERTVLRGHSDVVNDAAFSPDGQWVVTASKDHTAQVWEARTGKEVAVLRRHSGEVWHAAFSPDGQWAVTASEDGTARVWETRTGKEVAVLRGHRDWVTEATFSPNGQWVVTASGDQTARVWEAATGKERTVLRGHGGPVDEAVFSLDGQWVVTASKDRTAQVWETGTGKMVAELRGHSGSVNQAAFSPDGQWVVTASWDQTARVWEAATGKERTVLRGHSGAVSHAAFSPDGQWVVTASYDHTARVWRCELCASVEDLLNLAKTRTTRTLTPEERRLYLHE